MGDPIRVGVGGAGRSFGTPQQAFTAWQLCSRLGLVYTEAMEVLNNTALFALQTKKDILDVEQCCRDLQMAFGPAGRHQSQKPTLSVALVVLEVYKAIMRRHRGEHPFKRRDIPEMGKRAEVGFLELERFFGELEVEAADERGKTQVPIGS